MKMDLSIGLNILDGVSAPLKGMSAETNKYTDQIKKVEKAQAKDSAAMGMIDTYNKLKAAKKSNNLALRAEVEQLEALRQKSKGLQKPSAALTAKIEKQQVKVNKLNDSQQGFMLSMSKLRKSLTKTGVKVYRLDDEYTRLSRSYKGHGKEVNQLKKKYLTLQKAMKIPRGLNKALTMPKMEGTKDGLLAGTGVVGAMAGFGLLINDTATQLNDMAKAADDVEMPVSELQALRLQAKLAGAESADMDAAVKEMMLRWGEMKTLKSGTMNDYFKDTGNQKAYNDLMQAKNATEAYQVLLREIANETDKSKQNFMSDEFFGGDSEKMLAVLRSGTDGLTKAKQLLEDSGGPVSDESVENARMFTQALKKLDTITESLKISALTPIMAELSFLMEDLALNMKNMDWREDAIAQLRDIVKRTFEAFKVLGTGLIWLSENMGTVIGALAGLKVMLIGINLVALANPLGPIIIGIGALIAGVGYLIDKFGGLTNIMDTVKSIWDNFWGDGEGNKEVTLQAKETKRVLHTPDLTDADNSNALRENEERHDSVMTSASPPQSNQWQDEKVLEVKRQAKETKRVLHTSDLTEGSYHNSYQTLNQPKTNNNYGSSYRPITQQTMKSESEVSLTIKSDKPVAIDNTKSDEGTNLNLDVGNMATSF
ncbi:hypothetical protein ACED44_09475 [Vibrio splendidus]|uniref:hypothetical protein n=1 Tax=Vibrio splendidus TaxID=29497 RepID=UPI00352C73FE